MCGHWKTLGGLLQQVGQRCVAAAVCLTHVLWLQRLLDLLKLRLGGCCCTGRSGPEGRLRLLLSHHRHRDGLHQHERVIKKGLMEHCDMCSGRNAHLPDLLSQRSTLQLFQLRRSDLVLYAAPLPSLIALDPQWDLLQVRDNRLHDHHASGNGLLLHAGKGLQVQGQPGQAFSVAGNVSTLKVICLAGRTGSDGMS